MEWLKKFKELFKKENEKDDQLETPDEKRRRWRSIRVVYFTVFLMTLGFSVVLSGVWPYLDKLDPDAGIVFMGYVIAANPLGQLFFSVPVGWWSNKGGSIRMTQLCLIAVFIVSNGLYSFLEVIPSYKKYWMLTSRFLVGVSSANIAPCRSYLSAATRISERTGAVSMIALAQVLGFVFGPIIQATVTPLGETGLPLIGDLRLNMFTATGWINVILGIINFIMFLPFCFKDHPIAAKEIMKYHGLQTEKEAQKSIKPDKISCWTLIIAFFILGFNFVLVETLSTPLTMDEFAWSKAESLYYMGIIMAVGAVVACIVFAFTKKLTSIIEERKLMLWGGFLITGLASAFLLPWGPDPPKLAIPQNVPQNMTLQDLKEMAAASNFSVRHLLDSFALPDEKVLGCPVYQEWCANTPALTVTQLCVSYMCASIGYPLGTALIQSIFSKLLGPRPQGVWMGFMTSSGCLSRMLGPVFVGYVYSGLGPIWTFTTVLVIMSIAMLWIYCVLDRLIPVELKKNDTEMTEFSVKVNIDENEITEQSKLVENGKNLTNGKIVESNTKITR